MSSATVKRVGSILELHTPYNAGLVAALKSIAPEHRRWDAAAKVWHVSASQQTAVEQIVRQFYPDARIDAAQPMQAQRETRVLRVEYLSAPKERADGSFSSFGWCSESWSIVIPDRVLREWFKEAKRDEPQANSTLYGTLMITQQASADDIRSAYRRLARQWHPDVCSEPNAGDVFKQIVEANRILSDPLLRRKYNAGLALESSAQTKQTLRRRDLWNEVSRWQLPLRCGVITCEGTQELKFSVSRILLWQDIIDNTGRVLVTSWPIGADTFTRKWVEP
ncbi:MAG TPA: J domain-containing protein [Anaerolineae bacterium]